MWTGIKKDAWLIDDHHPAARLRDFQYAFPKNMQMASLFSFVVAGRATKTT
jgi:hypothetical protein